MKIVIAQLNPIIGDIEGNLARALEISSQAARADADLVVFSELFLTGYPPRDFLERAWFIERSQRALQELELFSQNYPDTGILIGAPLPTAQTSGLGLYNSAILICAGQTLLQQHKSLLPTYDVFDEARYFDPAEEIYTVNFKNEVLGISICEDAWNDRELWLKPIYTFDPIAELAAQGATLFVNISASPFYMGKDEIRYRLIANHARKHGIPFVYVNQVGGNDELIFDGTSLFVNGAGEVGAVGKSFHEDIITVDTAQPARASVYVPQHKIAAVHDALVLGLRDYMHKCGFLNAVVGLSGGIDSALTCCLAATAVGGENVLGISMPSPYSSRGSVEDSRQLAANLGVEFKVIPISEIFSAYLDALREHFAGLAPDVAEENIQARVRGNLLMAFSNKLGYLLLSTGNKSELAVGYCTLYGDMSGGLSVIADVPKTLVYELAAYINREREIIPRAIIEKAPSAELKPNQVDQDTLPPYDILDEILHYYVEEGCSVAEISARGFDPETVRWVAGAVERNEYKRRQAAPGLKVTTKAFGVGRRIPIAARHVI